MNTLRAAAAIALASTQVALAESCLPRGSLSFDYNSTNSLTLGTNRVSLRSQGFTDSEDLTSISNHLVHISQNISVEEDSLGYPIHNVLGKFREAICSFDADRIKPGDAYLVESVTFRAQLGESDFSVDENHFPKLNRALLQEGWIKLNFYLNTNELVKLQNGDPDGPSASSTTSYIGFNSFENSEQVCVNWVPVWDSENYAVGNIYDVTISGVNIVVGTGAALGISAAHESMPIRILTKNSEVSSDRIRTIDETSSLEGKKFDVSVSGMSIANAKITTELESENRAASFTHARGFGLQSATTVPGPWRDEYTTSYLGVYVEARAEGAPPSKFFRLSAGGVPFSPKAEP